MAAHRRWAADSDVTCVCCTAESCPVCVAPWSHLDGPAGVEGVYKGQEGVTRDAVLVCKGQRLQQEQQQLSARLGL